MVTLHSTVWYVITMRVVFLRVVLLKYSSPLQFYSPFAKAESHLTETERLLSAIKSVALKDKGPGKKQRANIVESLVLNDTHIYVLKNSHQRDCVT